MRGLCLGVEQNESHASAQLAPTAGSLSGAALSLGGGKWRRGTGSGAPLLELRGSYSEISRRDCDRHDVLRVGRIPPHENLIYMSCAVFVVERCCWKSKCFAHHA